MKVIKFYGALSNIKINYTKSEAMGVALSNSVRRTMQLNFKWMSSALKYLGTHIPPILANNFWGELSILI